MKKFEVQIHVTKKEIWHVSAKDEEEAEELVFEKGELYDTTESGHEYVEITEIENAKT